MSAASASAPGRVNLLGEHTDYNDGFVLPTAIAQQTRVSVEEIRAGFVLDALGERTVFSLEEPPRRQSARYVYGCLKELQEEGVRLPPLAIHVVSDVPMGVGLSSSAALSVATLRALRRLMALDLDDVRIARLAQRAETRHAGVQCGIMDQMASSLAEEGRMLFLDTRSLQRELLPLPGKSAVAVIDSGTPRSLAASGYNERRAQCERAAQALGVRALRDVEDARALDRLPELLRRRARHVVRENARVLQAARAATAEEFGRLMNASHDSLREDYEVSTPQLDALVGALRAQPAVYGAKLTGAGFGGACVALCRTGEARAAAESALRGYAGAGRILVA
jgi:galactokinase